MQQIIASIKTNPGQPTCHAENFTLIVYPHIEGQDGFSRELTDNQWVALGKALRHVHEFVLPPLIKDQTKQETYSPKWREAIRTIYAQIDTEKTATDEIGIKLLHFMKERKETIQHVVNRAEQLAQQIQKQSPKFVLCHSDEHEGTPLIARCL